MYSTVQYCRSKRTRRNAPENNKRLIVRGMAVMHSYQEAKDRTPFNPTDNQMRGRLVFVLLHCPQFGRLQLNFDRYCCAAKGFISNRPCLQAVNGI